MDIAEAMAQLRSLPADHTHDAAADCVKAMGLEPEIVLLGGVGDLDPAQRVKLHERYRILSRAGHPDSEFGRREQPLVDGYKRAKECYELLTGDRLLDRIPPPRRKSSTEEATTSSRWTDRRGHGTPRPVRPIPEIDVVDFGALAPGQYADDVMVAVYCMAGDEYVKLPADRKRKLSRYSGAFWAVVDTPITDDPESADFLLLNFEMTEPGRLGTIYEDQLTVSFGNQSVVLPIVATVMREPTIVGVSAVPDGLMVRLSVQVVPSEGVEVIIDWGDGTESIL